MLKFDLHTHHNRCGHAEGAIRDYIESAIEQGLAVIGISDHSPFFFSDEDRPYPSIAMAKSEFLRYVAEMLGLKHEFAGKIEVLLGVESDYFPEHLELYAEIYKQYPFDYVIGSVHMTGQTHVFDKRRWENQSPEQLLAQVETYYELNRRAAESGCFHIIGHLDALKRTNPAVAGIKTEKLDELLKAVAKSGAAMEINTSGIATPCASWYPSLEILERAFHYGVEVTFGSDAHTPGRVADDWDSVRRTLFEIGYREWAIFRRRKKYKLPL